MRLEAEASISEELVRENAPGTALVSRVTD